MKKLFKMGMVAGLLMVMPANNRVRIAPPQVQKVGDGKPRLEQLTVKELRAMAKQMKIAGRSKAIRKAQLIALIQEAM